MAKTKNHPGYLKLRGSSWQLQLCINGKVSYHTLGVMTREEAEQAARDKYKEESKQAERVAAGLPGPVRFSRLLAMYQEQVLDEKAPNTRKAYKLSMDRFREFFVVQLKDPRVDKIRSPHVRAFLSWRKKAGVSARTIAKDRATLHALFNYAMNDAEVVEFNPVRAVRPPKVEGREPVILKPEQYEALLRACGANDMLSLFVLVLGETGVRSGSEALWLRWEHLDLEGGRITVQSERGVHRTKSGKSRVVPMSPRLKQALAQHALKYRGALYNGKTSPWVFHHPRARRRARAGERIGSLRRAFEAAARRAKLPDLHQHDLRHTRVTTWLAKGANPVHVKEAVGHSDLRTTMHYTHLAEEHVAALAALESPSVERARSASN